ncbi:DegT/DnrJ/EryC1/StrS family aminotransferase, partial [Streptomyces sp. NPDC020125]|uniref:DegT/DnrJ/EryC1/StrS family aminotransferase n=1 Tax=Streptomyces sp. NPDC020125 TaxID=3154593 RepID=UPI00340430E7
MFRVPGLTEERRAKIVDVLIERGVPAFVAFRALYRTDAFWEIAAPDLTVDELARRCPHSEALTRDCLWLHHRVLLGSEEQMHEVAAVVADVLAGS